MTTNAHLSINLQISHILSLSTFSANVLSHYQQFSVSRRLSDFLKTSKKFCCWTHRRRFTASCVHNAAQVGSSRGGRTASHQVW